MVYTAGSLFSGIGGIDLAFARSGFDIRWQVEIEPFCQAVLRKHAPDYWPNAQVWSDVKQVGQEQLEPVDVIFGGFPCQDISHAGKGAGIAEGTRSGLWYEFRRIIGDLRPRVVFLENVAAIATRGGTEVIGQLTALGYDAWWGVVPASAIGAPHQRERWWCVAYRNGLGCAGSQPDQSGADIDRLLPPPEQARWAELHATLASGEADNVAYAQHLRLDSPALTGGDAPPVLGGAQGAERPGEPAGSRASRTAPSGAVAYANSGRHNGRGQSIRGDEGADGGATPQRTAPAGETAGRGAGAVAYTAEQRLSAGQHTGQPAHSAQADAGLESQPERYRAVGDTDEPRLQGIGASGQQVPQVAAEPSERRGTGDGAGRRTIESRLGGIVFDGLPGRLDSARYEFWAAGPHQPQHAYEPPRTGRGIRNRAARLRALGNAVVVPLVQIFAEGIADALRQEDGTHPA